MPSSVIGPLVGAAASSILGGGGDAADAQAAAQQQGIKLQKEMYDQTRKDLSPYRDIGGAGAYTLAQLLGLYNPYQQGNTNTVIGGLPSASASASASGTAGNPTPASFDGEDDRERPTDGFNTLVSEGVNADTGKKHYTYKNRWGSWRVDENGRFMSGSTAAMVKGGFNGAVNTGSANASANAGAGNQSGQSAPDNFGWLLKRLQDTDWTTDPGYQFRLSEGQKGLDRSYAAQGGLLSGAAAKAAARYNQDFASNEYGNVYNRFTNDQTNIYNRLMGVTNVGQNAAAQQASSNQTNANQLGQYYGNIGDARANAAINKGNSFSQGLAGLFGGSQYSYKNPMDQFGGWGANAGNQYGIIWD